MIFHKDISSRQLLRSIRQSGIVFAGNRKLRIYGQLDCKSGKRMGKENRVFFQFEEEALESGYRPCAKCSNEKYKHWKNGTF